ncbi:hypothetical protein COCNU_09G007450 [Cocos nucifera]|uniref:S1 motif domain-containing protein n=1 Tax=Cocos nucifera TaxID=13894 RepID=A0A8K0IK36_COCNU|nr:hypothetical protein COCNU_09G007450 [Cocos nucifera]
MKLQGIEDGDWKKAQDLLQTGEKVEVELISCSSRGFVVSFGSLIGFVPYRNLSAKWKFLAFESWLRKKGLDPSLYRQHLSILGTNSVNVKNPGLESGRSQEISQKDEVLPPNMKFESLLEAYDQEKTKFLSSFIGQRIRLSVILVDRNSRKIMFSGKPKEKEELVEKKRSLMARLSIGDVVKCRIKKITFFGIFVEVEGVPALIHQSEVSWDATLDPSSFYKIGQIVEAKVHQLDYGLERITLSLKEITPNPLMEALESVVGERTSVGGSLEAAQADIEVALISWKPTLPSFIEMPYVKSVLMFDFLTKSKRNAKEQNAKSGLTVLKRRFLLVIFRLGLDQLSHLRCSTSMGAGESGRNLEDTSTWAVATICAALVVISIIIEHGIHLASRNKVPFISADGLHQLHIFIFVLAVFHVLYCITTMALGSLKMRRWKSWELETRTPEYQFSHDPDRFRLARDTSFGQRHLNFWSKSPILTWIVCFFRQFVRSVPKVDYLTLRHGFIMAHLAPQSSSNFDFQNYIKRSLEEDMKCVVGISVLIQVLCSYVTLPLYALVTQMGSNMRPTIFSERVATALRKWHHTASNHLKENGQFGHITPLSTSTPTMPTSGSSRANLLRHLQKLDSFQGSSNRCSFNKEHFDIERSPLPFYHTINGLSSPQQKIRPQQEVPSPSNHTINGLSSQQQKIRPQQEVKGVEIEMQESAGSVQLPPLEDSNHQHRIEISPDIIFDRREG